MSEVRPFITSDVPVVAEMFQRILRKTSQSATSSLEIYLRELFLEAPDAQHDITSLIHQRDDGSVSGFVGVVPLALEFEGRPLRGALCGTMMVDGHKEDPFAGARLLRAFLAGPQDISLTETANDVSTAMWRKMNAAVLPDYSLEWIRVIRPAGFMVELAAADVSAARVFSPLARPIDAFIRRRPIDGEPHWSHFTSAPKGKLVDTDVDEDELLDLIPKLAAHYPMRPAWRRETLARIIVHARRKANYGPGVRRVVRTGTGHPVGLYIYYGDRGRIGRAFQVMALPGQEGAVIDNMIAHAASNGLVALRGRTQPALLNAMLGRRFAFVHASSSIVHARDPALIQPFLDGRAFFNGFAGESWCRLMGDAFD
ncbi:hypothetical protein [Aminobacter sp. AP02]|uniref:hypothetical protein n=1 Tax=Aminobacter sp. AP02 TaxID=2135737 RepID=UPI001FE04C10|nr:hypothetical protein [Aminobacter sp. AP02]